MTEPIISVISPAIKTHYWAEFYHCLTLNNSIPWEIVFVGPRASDFPLPENFRHIQADLKPAQCLEIAAIEARGEYLIVVPDDTRPLPGFLDGVHYYKYRLPPFSVVGARTGWDKAYGEREERCGIYVFLPKENGGPVLPACGMLKKSEWVELGGVDSQFVGLCGDMDLFMRALARGGYPFISPDSITYERMIGKNDLQVPLFRRHKSDYYFFVDQWVDRDAEKTVVLGYRKQRRDPIIPFDHKTIMDYNQGNVRGEWA